MEIFVALLHLLLTQTLSVAEELASLLLRHERAYTANGSLSDAQHHVEGLVHERHGTVGWSKVLHDRSMEPGRACERARVHCLLIFRLSVRWALPVPRESVGSGLRFLAVRNQLTTQVLAMTHANDHGDPSVIVIREECRGAARGVIVARFHAPTLLP